MSLNIVACRTDLCFPGGRKRAMHLSTLLLVVPSTLPKVTQAALFCVSLIVMRSGKAIPSETPEDVLTKEAAGEVFSVDTYGNPQVGRASCTSCGDQQAKSTGSDGTQFSRNPQRSDEPAIVPLHQFVRLDELNFQTPRKITLRIW